MCETAKKKLADLIFLQARSSQDILRAQLKLFEYEKNNDLENEIKQMENYTGYTEDEREELKLTKILKFTRDQDVMLMKFLIDQFTKREVFFGSLEK